MYIDHNSLWEVNGGSPLWDLCRLSLPCSSLQSPLAIMRGRVCTIWFLHASSELDVAIFQTRFRPPCLDLILHFETVDDVMSCPVLRKE